MGGSRGRIAFVAMALLCAWCTCVDAQLLPNSDEFLVNSYTTSAQNGPHISASTPGDFVVAWTSYGQDGYGFGIVARQFADPITPLAVEFQVNTYTTSDQENQFVLARPTGDFVIAWSSYYQDGDLTGVFAQRFSSAATPLGTEFQVNSNTIHYQSSPFMISLGTGFLITWSDEIDNSNGHIKALRYDSNGMPIGTEFQVNSVSTSNKFPSTVIPVNQGFLVSWSESFDRDGDGSAVLARIFDSTGVALGTEFVINTYTPGFQGSSRAVSNADGSFVIVWSGSVAGDSSGSGIAGQRFDSSGMPSGTEFQVNTYTGFTQTRPEIAGSGNGDFVVAWQSLNQDGSGYGIFTRGFKADGTPDTPEIQVNQFIAGHQILPGIAAVDDRSVVVVWQSAAQDGSFNGIYGRRFKLAGDRLNGKKLVIRTSAAPSGNALTFVSKDPALEMPQDVLEDPRCPPAGSGALDSGAKLRVVGAGGDFTIDLPCINWSVNDAGTRYRYRDATGATCNAIVLRAGRLMKAICRGAQVDYELGSAQGDVHVVLTTGDPSTNRKYCATFGPQTAATVVRDGSDGRSYRAVEAGTGVCP